jgi:hypothetical protein
MFFKEDDLMKTIKLSEPIRVKTFFGFEETIDIISIRAPKAKDIMGLPFNDPNKQTEAMGVLISRLSGLSMDVVEEMDLADFLNVSNAMQTYLEGER